MNFHEILKQDIKELVEEFASEILIPQEIFARLPEVCTPKELGKVYKVSSEVIVRMAKTGMPHTHVGQKYRFHKSLLIEWTRDGETPRPCAKCNKKQASPKEDISNVRKFPKSEMKQKLAKLST